MFPFIEHLLGFCLQQVISGIHAKGQFVIVRKMVGDFPVDVVKGITHVLLSSGLERLSRKNTGAVKRSAQLLRMAMLNEVLSFMIGPSNWTLPSSSPKEKVP